MAFKSMPCGKCLFYQQKQNVAKPFHSFVGTLVTANTSITKGFTWVTVAALMFKHYLGQISWDSGQIRIDQRRWRNFLTTAAIRKHYPLLQNSLFRFEPRSVGKNLCIATHQISSIGR